MLEVKWKLTKVIVLTLVVYKQTQNGLFLISLLLIVLVQYFSCFVMLKMNENNCEKLRELHVSQRRKFETSMTMNNSKNVKSDLYRLYWRKYFDQSNLLASLCNCYNYLMEMTYVWTSKVVSHVIWCMMSVPYCFNVV